MRWNHKMSIFKNHLSGLEFEADKSRYGVYATHYWNLMNRLPPWSSLGEQFLRFSINDLSWFHLIFLLFDTRKSCVFQIFLLRSIKAYLCPNIIDFDSMDFSERRPEEVIKFLLTLSVYQVSCYTRMKKKIWALSSKITLLGL